MVSLAYQCVNDPAYAVQSKAAFDYIMHKRDDKGLYGNEYSTALAVQVGIVNKLYLKQTNICIENKSICTNGKVQKQPSHP